MAAGGDGDATSATRATAAAGSAGAVSARPRRPRPAPFQPRATLGLVYIFALFMLYALLLISPTLFEVFQSGPPGPELERAAAEAAREAARPRLLWALLLAVGTTALGTYYRVLPGLRR